MRQLVLALAKKFDYVVVDCPAGIEQGFQNAIAAAREAIIVTTPEIAAVRDADRVIGLLEAGGVRSIRLIVNRLRSHMVAANDMMSVDDVRELLAIPLIGIVPDDEQVIVSTNRGEPLVLNETLSLAGQAFDNIASRLEGQDVEFLDLSPPDENWLTRVKNFLKQRLF
jgi:septum site-determining protein MinD